MFFTPPKHLQAKDTKEQFYSTAALSALFTNPLLYCTNGLVNNADKATVLYKWLENYLNIINTYSQALEMLGNYKGNIFYPSETS